MPTASLTGAWAMPSFHAHLNREKTMENTAVSTELAPSQDAKNMALLTWVGTLFLGFIPSLIIYLVKKDDAYVQDQS